MVVITLEGTVRTPCRVFLRSYRQVHIFPNLRQPFVTKWMMDSAHAKCMLIGWAHEKTCKPTKNSRAQVSSSGAAADKLEMVSFIFGGPKVTGSTCTAFTWSQKLVTTFQLQYIEYWADHPCISLKPYKTNDSLLTSDQMCLCINK